jgi:hypothetical protein
VAVWFDPSAAQPGHCIPLRRQTRRQSLEPHELARHAELLGLGAAGGDELAGALRSPGASRSTSISA